MSSGRLTAAIADLAVEDTAEERVRSRRLRKGSPIPDFYRQVGEIRRRIARVDRGLDELAGILERMRRSSERP